MRLHTLRLQAFGPFATEQVIDFDRVASSGLFLLDGPTGAGKSTVLDAITFALYGPGERGGDDRLHSHFAASGTPPQVGLEFSVNGVRHRVTRTPEHQRPKKNGTGLTRQPAAVHLERVEDGEWVSRSANKAEVAEQLAEVLGLTRDQFTQVVLLPQGEFATFLRAGDDQRRELLSKLFGTRLYDRITDELDGRRAEAVKDIEAAQVDVQACVAAAAEAAGLPAEEAVALRDVPAGELTDRLDGLAERLATAAATAEAAAAAAQGAAAAARDEAVAAEAAADRMARYAAAVAAAETHEASRPEHLARVERLAAARRAEPVRPLLTAAREAAEASELARAAVRAVAPDAEPGWLAGDGAAELDERSRAADQDAAGLRHLVEREASLPGLTAAVRAAETAATQADRALDQLAARQTALPAEAARVEAEIVASRHEAERLPVLRAEQETTVRQLAAARTAAGLQARVAQARAEAVAATDAHQQAVDGHQRLMEVRLSGMAAELAADLRDGQPCPVCGASGHPAPAQPALDAVTAEQLDRAARDRDAAAQARDAAQIAAQEAELRLTAAQAAAGNAPVEALEARAAELATQIESTDAAAARLADLVERKRALDAEAESLAREHAEALAARATAGERLAAARAEHDRLVAELADAAGDEPSVAARQQRLHQDAAHCRELAAAVEALATAVTTQAEVQRRAVVEAAAQGFPTADAAADAVLAAADQDNLAAEVETWAAESERLAAATTAAEFADCANTETTASATAAEATARAVRAAAVRRETEAVARTTADTAGRARHAAARFAERRADLEAALGRLAALQAAAEPVVYLAKLAKGMTGQRRVALTTYVLRHWFERVVQAANLRLAEMSSGRYELVRVDELAGPGQRTQRTGLTLQVLDRHTGEQRSAKSLSGGETFYTSLALALGLADVVKAEAGGVDLDTLFIDEGFGSLDADTLEEVMSVIDELRDRGRVVGIVSHVGDLKDRIAERVEVRRRPDGSSELRVVA